MYIYFNDIGNLSHGFHCADHPWLQNINKAPNVSLGETVKARLKQFSVMNKLKKRALRVILDLCVNFIFVVESRIFLGHGHLIYNNQCHMIR